MIAARSRDRSWLWFLLCGAAFGTFFALYGRALPYPPAFDDFGNVIQNRAVRYLLHPRIFLESDASRYRPLPFVSFALSYWIWGLSLSGLRVVGLAVHAANAVLVGLLYRRWLGAERAAWGALAAGALFLLHPLATDAVIYLSARGSLLVLCFLLCALLFHARDKQGLGSLLGFLACAGLAFFSRESAAALAPLLLAVHWQSRRRHTELVPYLGPLLVGGAVVLAIKANYLGAAWKGLFTIQGDVDLRSAGEYFRFSLSLWPKIVALFFSPGRQAIDHHLFAPDSWSDPAAILGIVVFGGLVLACTAFFRTRSRWLFPFCWLLFSLLPTNSVFPLLDPFAERHFYFALPALAWLFGLGIERFFRGAGLAAAMASLLLAANFVSLPRVLTWRSASELWLDAQGKYPTKFRIAFNAASSLLSERGDRERALRVFWQAVQPLAPGALRYEEQDQGLGLMVGALKGLAEDRGVPPRELWRSLGFGAGYWAELVLLRAELGSVPASEWERNWQEALQRVVEEPLSPRARDVHWVLSTFLLLKAEFLREAGRRLEALRTYELVIRPFGTEHFPYWTAREALADLYWEVGREDEALEQYELAAYQYKVFKRFPLSIHRRLYQIFESRGDWHRASDAVGELVRVRTDDPELRALYAGLLRKKMDKHAARQTKEAGFYQRSAVAPDEDREVLKP